MCVFLASFWRNCLEIGPEPMSGPEKKTDPLKKEFAG